MANCVGCYNAAQQNANKQCLTKNTMAMRNVLYKAESNLFLKYVVALFEVADNGNTAYEVESWRGVNKYEKLSDAKRKFREYASEIIFALD